MLWDTKSQGELHISWRCWNGLPKTIPLSLYLPKTPEVHISLCYRSLGVTSAQAKAHYYFFVDEHGAKDDCILQELSAAIIQPPSVQGQSWHLCANAMPQGLCLSEHHCKDAVLQSRNEGLRREDYRSRGSWTLTWAPCLGPGLHLQLAAKPSRNTHLSFSFLCLVYHSQSN